MSTEVKNYLEIDDCFGIYTRQGLIWNVCNGKIPNVVLNVVLLDFDNVHSMNNDFGYQKVNQMFRTTFQLWQQQYPHMVIGRVFSGDEIAIVWDATKIEDCVRAVTRLFHLFNPEHFSAKFHQYTYKLQYYLDTNLVDFSKSLDRNMELMQDYHAVYLSKLVI